MFSYFIRGQRSEVKRGSYFSLPCVVGGWHGALKQGIMPAANGACDVRVAANALHVLFTAVVCAQRKSVSGSVCMNVVCSKSLRESKMRRKMS